MRKVNSQKYSSNDIQDVVKHACFKQTGHKDVGVLDFPTVYADIGNGFGTEFDFPEEVSKMNYQKNQNDYSDDNHISGCPGAGSAGIFGFIFYRTCTPVFILQKKTPGNMNQKANCQDRLHDFYKRVCGHKIGSNIKKFATVVKN